MVTKDDVLDALERFRAADAAMHLRVRETSALGDNELRMLQYLLLRRREGAVVRPSELSRHLGITSASTTALLDRLERSGHVSRGPNPTDRRSVLVTLSEKSDDEIRHTLSAMHERMMAIVRGMDPDQRATVIGFLDAMREAVDQIDA